MQLYQFNLPVHTNKGLSYELARKKWLDKALVLAGGYTVPTTLSHGVWLPPNGAECRDLIQPVQVAVASKGIYLQLLDAAFALFPDQEAIFVGKLGFATIHARAADGILGATDEVEE